MPITSVASWLPTIDEFLAHWAEANIALGTQLTLSGGYTRSTLAAARTSLSSARFEVQAKETARQSAAGERDQLREALRSRFLQFGPAVRGFLPGSRFNSMLPRSPSFHDGPRKWQNAVEDMGAIWQAINENNPPVPAFIPPLRLSGGYDLQKFAEEAAALFMAFSDVERTEQEAHAARRQRNQIFEPIYVRLKQYRQVVIATFEPSSPIVKEMPALTPPPDGLPEPVQLSGSWQAMAGHAELVWSESKDPELQSYSVRYHSGPKYKADEEQLVETVLPGTMRFCTTYGLPASGSVAWFKVYMTTLSGKERGSNAVKVVRKA